MNRRTGRRDGAQDVTITLNGDPFEIDRPLAVSELLARLEIDPRRVAVEHNLVVLRRTAFADTVVNAGDQVEIVNFVGGGWQPGGGSHPPAGCERPEVSPPRRKARSPRTRNHWS